MKEIEIKRRKETKKIEAHYDTSFWQDLKGEKGTYYPERIEKTTWYDVVLNGKVVQSYTYRPHAKEWIENYNLTKSNLKLVEEFEKIREQLRNLNNAYETLTKEFDWLYDHKLKYIKGEK